MEYKKGVSMDEAIINDFYQGKSMQYICQHYDVNVRRIKALVYASVFIKSIRSKYELDNYIQEK